MADKVLRSDSERFNDELAAAGKHSQKGVIKKYQSIVCEREKVRCFPVRCNSVDSFIFQFSGAMVRLRELAERAKEEAREDVRERRIERFVVDLYLSVSGKIHEHSAGSGKNSPKMDGVRKLRLTSQCTNRDCWRSKV